MSKIHFKIAIKNYDIIYFLLLSVLAKQLIITIIMKRFLYICILILLMPLVHAVELPPATNVLEGKITDSNGQPIVGATVYFAELKTGAVSDINGRYKVSNLPARNLLVQISFVGYKMQTLTVNPAHQSHLNFTMEESVTEIAEVAVTGRGIATQVEKLPTPISVISTAELQQTSSTNIIDALSHQPGVSQITTGSGISKPVIRGLGYNRVVVVNDGVRQEGQQWGDEHGIEVDEANISRIEILKGPASLMYGSDAMAGVINLFSSPILPQGKMSLNVLANYQTNNGLRAYSLDYAGHKNTFVWDVRYSNKTAHAYQNKYDGYVFNSGFSEHALSGLVGLSSWWGYSHLTLSTYQLKPGIVEGDRSDLTGQFIRETADGEEIVNNTDLKSYSLQVPYQHVNHYKALWSNNLLLGEGSLKATVGYQQNQRQEYADPAAPNDYGLFFKLHTVNYNVLYQFPETKGYNFSAGVGGMYQKSLNLGSEFLVPEYHLFDAGWFVMGDKTVGKFDLSGGLRFDNRSQKAAQLIENDALRFEAFSKNFSGVSGSLGASYHVSKDWTMKLNLSRGYRAPNISELGSNGVHEGTLRYETGNTRLKPEQSMQLDYELGFINNHVTARLNLFANTINNFIYLHKLSANAVGDSIRDEVPVYKFDQGHALLAGGEFYLDIHPHPWDWLHFENSFSYVHSALLNQPDSMSHLPFTPPAKWTSDLRFDLSVCRKHFQNTYLNIGIEKYFAQNDIYSAYGTETATPGYALLNAGIGTDIVRKKKTLCSLYIVGTNLTDMAYQSHLSRLKYADENVATGRSGVYNMGRNISIKAIIPVDL